jgi:membrane-associated phospholipid phosphatase
MKTFDRPARSEGVRTLPLVWSSAWSDKQRLNAPAWLGEIRESLGIFEWLTFGYLFILDSLILLRHRNAAHPYEIVLAHLTFAAAILFLAWKSRRTDNVAIHFLRCWYPLAAYLFFFEELGALVHLVFPGWFDAWLVRFDFRLFGVHPSVWLSQFANPALNDYMQFAYMTYFLYLVMLPFTLYVRREWSAFWTLMVSTAVANYLVYLIAIFFPVESPFYTLANLQRVALTGGRVTALMNLIERYGRVHGAAFPSDHVAASTVAMLCSWRYCRWLFWLCLPFYISMMVATVYGRYHYVADVFGGLAMGGIGYFVGRTLMRRFHGA